MKKITKAKFSLLLCSLLISVHAFSQLTVNNSLIPQQLVQSVLLGPGVTVSNVTFTGAANAIGQFNGTSSNVGLNSGVLITTGDIVFAPGPNLTDAGGTDNFAPGNATMDLLAGQTTFDASILEFDFIPVTDTVTFRYVFGSEEYPEFVNQGYNDVFGFFLSGPGITGPYPGNSINIALIPSTTIPVAIDNVNNGYNFACVSPLPGPCTYCAYYVDNCSGVTVEYDGFTTAITATAIVQHCNTYHIRIAIADAGDGIYDSGVFLEAGSFSSTNPLTANASIIGQSSGCAPLFVSFLNQSIGADLYSWNFGDSSPTDTSTNPNHTFTSTGVYTVMLIAIDTSACNYSDTTYLTVTVNQGSVNAAFNLIQNSNCDSLFINAVSNGSGGQVFQWDFGDGNNATGVNVSHAYTLAGNYIITLIVTDTICNVSDTAMATVSFSPSGINASFNMAQNSSCDTLFISATSNGVGGQIFQWNFGDGNTATGASVNYFYLIAGTYTITLTVIDTVCNVTDTATATVTFSPNVNANIIIPGASGCAPLSVVFCADTSAGSFYQWDFGDGNISSQPCFKNIYLSSGVYNVTLIVSNLSSCNLSDTAYTTVTVFAPPVADFTITNSVQSVNFPVSFTDNSTGAASYFWMFGDGATDSQQNPEHLYNAPATWDVCLVATNQNGCKDTACKQVTLFDEPVDVFVPNAFTPNGDNVNEYFFPVGIGITDYTMEIFDRWGEKIYSDNSSGKGWDGNYRQQLAPVGIYVYVIRVNFRNEDWKELKGHIALVR
jgi:gliding motility-associated-like protein